MFSVISISAVGLKEHFSEELCMAKELVGVLVLWEYLKYTATNNAKVPIISKYPIAITIFRRSFTPGDNSELVIFPPIDCSSR